MRSTITFLAILAAIVLYPEALNIWMLVFGMIIWVLHYLLDHSCATQRGRRVLGNISSSNGEDDQANRRS